MKQLPNRGEIWLADLDPTKGHEQAGTRPCLVISTNAFNHGPSELVWIIPLTTKDKGIPFHVLLRSRESGLRERSYIKVEDLRSVARLRLRKRIGAAPAAVLSDVEDRLRILLEIQ
jgi:mRNA interferase MazF